MSIYNVNPVSVNDYRIRAKRRLPRFLFDYNEEYAPISSPTPPPDTRRQYRTVTDIKKATTLVGRDFQDGTGRYRTLIWRTREDSNLRPLGS